MYLEDEIKKIQMTESKLIADLLGCSINQANKYKRGYSGLSNHQALFLEKELDLNPKGFEEIRSSYQLNKGNNT